MQLQCVEFFQKVQTCAWHLAPGHGTDDHDLETVTVLWHISPFYTKMDFLGAPALVPTSEPLLSCPGKGGI